MRRPRHRWLIAGALLAALVFIAGAFAGAESPRYAPRRTPIAVHAMPIDAFDPSDKSRTRFGALEFRGGLVLTSDSRAFGGFSALHVEPDGAHFLALSDNGSWLKGRIVYRDGRPVGIADAEMAPMLAWDGKPLAAHGWFDSESLADDHGILYVGIERVEKIVRFNYHRDGLAARGKPIHVPADFKTFSYNKSLECLAVPPKGAPYAGALIAVTERSLDAAGNHRSYVLDGRRVTRFSVKRRNGFDVSDCAFLPPGDVLLLERRFIPPLNLAIRIRRLHLTDIKPGALIDGTVLLKADLADEIDNMEGLAVTRNTRGEIILTLVSDDNFSPLQHNLLLQFALVGK